MSNVKRMQIDTLIKAPVALVWEVMLDAENYSLWTAPFCEGSYYDGSWNQGSRIRFLSPSGDGMVAEIAENRPHEFISVRSWAPAYENYTFCQVPEGTQLVVEQDVTEDYEQSMKEIWPKALDQLKQLCEDKSNI